jgi:hypothetical protein
MAHLIIKAEVSVHEFPIFLHVISDSALSFPQMRHRESKNSWMRIMETCTFPRKHHILCALFILIQSDQPDTIIEAERKESPLVCFAGETESPADKALETAMLKLSISGVSATHGPDVRTEAWDGSAWEATGEMEVMAEAEQLERFLGCAAHLTGCWSWGR